MIPEACKNFIFRNEPQMKKLLYGEESMLGRRNYILHDLKKCLETQRLHDLAMNRCCQIYLALPSVPNIMKKPHRNENSRKNTPPRDETVKDAFGVLNVKSKRNPKPCCRCKTSPQLSLIGTFDESVSTQNATPGSTQNVMLLS